MMMEFRSATRASERTNPVFPWISNWSLLILIRLGYLSARQALARQLILIDFIYLPRCASTGVSGRDRERLNISFHGWDDCPVVASAFPVADRFILVE